MENVEWARYRAMNDTQKTQVGTTSTFSEVREAKKPTDDQQLKTQSESKEANG